MNGNIVQTNKAMNNIEFDAIAVGGAGSRYGNASATLNGNIFQPKSANSVRLEAWAYSNGPDDPSHDGDPNFGTKTATINGNIVQGNIDNVWLSARAFCSNGTAHVGTFSTNKPAGLGWTLRGAEDYNRDGVSDLIWQKGGTTDVQLMNNTVTPGSLLNLTNAPGAAFTVIASTGGG